MSGILYVIKVVIIFWFVKFVSELIGEGIVIGLLFACGKNPLEGEMFDPEIMVLIMYFGYPNDEEYAKAMEDLAKIDAELA